jgi:hypothetical protein
MHARPFSTQRNEEEKQMDHEYRPEDRESPKAGKQLSYDEFWVGLFEAEEEQFNEMMQVVAGEERVEADEAK